MGKTGNKCGGKRSECSQVGWGVIIPLISAISDRKKTGRRKNGALDAELALVDSQAHWLFPALPIHHLEATYKKKRSCGALKKKNKQKRKFEAQIHAFPDPDLIITRTNWVEF